MSLEGPFAAAIEDDGGGHNLIVISRVHVWWVAIRIDLIHLTRERVPGSIYHRPGDDWGE